MKSKTNKQQISLAITTEFLKRMKGRNHSYDEIFNLIQEAEYCGNNGFKINEKLAATCEHLFIQRKIATSSELNILNALAQNMNLYPEIQEILLNKIVDCNLCTTLVFHYMCHTRWICLSLLRNTNITPQILSALYLKAQQHHFNVRIEPSFYKNYKTQELAETLNLLK